MRKSFTDLAKKVDELEKKVSESKKRKVIERRLLLSSRNASLSFNYFFLFLVLRSQQCKDNTADIKRIDKIIAEQDKQIKRLKEKVSVPKACLVFLCLVL